MKTRILGFLFISLLLISGCNILESNRAKWQAAGITSYRMKVAIQKPGHGTPMGTYLITVTDGKAVEILSGPSSNAGQVVQPKTPITDRKYPINYDRYDTIEDYFKIVDDGGGGFGVNILYDPTYGYPAYIHFGGSNVDEGLKLEVIEFEKIS